MIRVDLHVHSRYSRDSDSRLEDILAACRQRGIDRVAVTDHGTIQGALALHRMAPERVIVGQEIRTNRGELIAYFVREEVPSDLELHEAVRRLHAQGAIVGVPHPLDRLRREALGLPALLEIIDDIDCLEVFNARVLWSAHNVEARRLADAHGLPATAGSDAHSVDRIGQAYVELPAFDSAAGFLDSIRAGTVHGRLSGFGVHLQSTLARVKKRAGRAPIARRSS